MKTGAVVAVVVGAAVILFWAASRGLISSGVQVNPSGTVSGIVAPQPASNYSGYLAASTAPGVAGALNSILTGAGSAASSWLRASAPQPTAGPNQGANPASPSLAAQPSGPITPGSPNFVGPMVPPDLSYDATNASAFDYSGLSADNAYDPSASLEYV